MRNDGKDGALRRRRFSESMSWNSEHEPETRQHTTAGTLKHHQHERGDDDDDDDDEEQDEKSEKARKESFSSVTYQRRSTDVQELLRRGFGSVRRSFDGVST
jgi:hypothetical protein